MRGSRTACILAEMYLRMQTTNSIHGHGSLQRLIHGSLQRLPLQNHLTKNVKYNSDKPWFTPEIMGLPKKEDFQSQKRKERMTAYIKAKYNLYRNVWAQKANTISLKVNIYTYQLVTSIYQYSQSLLCHYIVLSYAINYCSFT